jgi:L-threonylcarbamoyladenylate synthase
MVISIDSPGAPRLVADRLAGANVVILPTDTIYGFSGIVPQTEPAIRRLKGREETKPFLMLIGDPAWIGSFSPLALPRAFLKYWPGPLTLIFPGRRAGETHAFRHPADRFLADVLARLGRPVYSTSVNRSGQPVLGKINEIVDQFDSKVDAIVAAGDRPEAAASTIVDLTVRPYRIVRQGMLVIPPEELAAESE